MKNFEMTSYKVLSLYNWFQENGITIWIDGGWCVEALLNFQTRKHDDLDIVVSRKDNIKFVSCLKIKDTEKKNAMIFGNVIKL